MLRTTRLSLLGGHDALYGRDAGLGDRLDRQDAMGTAQLADAFVDASEFQQLHGEIRNDAFVDLMYAKVLEREADSAGRDYWIGQLEAGDSLGAVMVGFTESQESLMLVG